MLVNPLRLISVGFASRSTVLGGSAVFEVANTLLAKIRAAAGARLGCAAEQIELADGCARAADCCRSERPRRQTPFLRRLNAHYKKRESSNPAPKRPAPNRYRQGCVHGTAQAKTSGYQRRDALHHHIGDDVGGAYDGRGGAG